MLIVLGLVVTLSSAYHINDELPSTWDWRQHNAVTPVYNQGQSGSDMSFAITESVEGLHAITTGHLVGLDVGEVGKCCPSEEANFEIYHCIIKIGGICAGQASNPPCSNKTCSIVGNLTGYVAVPSGNESALQQAVYANPVAAGIDAATLQLYTGGIIKGKCGNSIDHLVLVVGWNVENDQPYWICKNSWGTSWGEEGYFYIARDDNDECGIALFASYPVLN